MGRIKVNPRPVKTARKKAVQIPLLVEDSDREELKRLFYHFGFNHQHRSSSRSAFISLLCNHTMHIRDIRLQKRIINMSREEITALVDRLGW